MAKVDYDKQSAVYDRGRTLPPEAIASWMIASRRHIGDRAGRILDLGAGTGRFSAALADAFDAVVVAVEPSAGMRGRAAAKEHERVRLAGGCAEHLPLRAGSVDASWLSNVIHHFDDLDAAASELRRVVVDGGPVLVRGAFAGRGPVPTLYRFFPGAERVIESFPTIEGTVEAFERAGFHSVSVERVEQLLAHRLSDMVERIRMRADTSLELLPDDEFEAGLARLEAAAQTEDDPVVDALDLVVLR